MKDLFQWTPELWCEFLNQRPLIGALETEMEQFKSSKAPKKEWEIVAFGEREGDAVYYYDLQPEGNYKSRSNPGTSLRWPLCKFNGPSGFIHSVRRLSDGEVFSVGDRIKNHSLPIARIVIDTGWTGGIRLECPHENEARGIKDAEKLPQPILTTVDQKEVKEGDLVFYVNSDNFISDIWVTKDSFGDDKNPSNVFSTREAAEHYILQNRPLLSLSDVKEALGSDYRVHSEVLLSELTALVKQKLNP